MMRRIVLLIALLTLTVGLSACSQSRYLAQAVRGQWQLLNQRQPVQDLIAAAETPPQLRQRLVLAQQIRQFAIHHLHLPDNRSYTTYADTARPYVVNNVVAVPRFSLTPKTWCFAFAGCVPYKGYFSAAAAAHAEDELRAQGFDTVRYGVAAYSTLGWFADPLLNTFIDYAEHDLAAVIFHELAHARVYLKDDAAFNEAFATAVETEGLARWLRYRDKTAQIALVQQQRQQRNDIIELILTYRTRLGTLYASNQSTADKAAQKRRLLLDLRQAYQNRFATDAPNRPFAGWFAQDLNNAHLALLSTYHRQVPAFLALLRQHHNDLPKFYQAVEELAKLPAAERQLVLSF